jgi:hypothetical protein
MLSKMSKRRLLRLWTGGTGVLAVGASVYFLHKNDWQLSSIGAVRFARAASAVRFD